MVSARSVCSESSPRMRSALWRLFSMLLRRTAASASASETFASAADRRERCCSASTSFWRIRSARASLRE